MKKILVIGASYLQVPLIEKINAMGYESHVAAWEDGATAKGVSTVFYPISITEKEELLKLARELNPVAVVSIASDLAGITVNYIASNLGLVCNPESTIECTSNKYLMRELLSNSGILCPKYLLVKSVNDIDKISMSYPVIVKPIDRSGSRGVSLVQNSKEFVAAVCLALSESFSKEVLIEQYIDGVEVSVESISQNGRHEILSITDKSTTGAPHFVELGHSEPSKLSIEICEKIEQSTFSVLKATGIQFGASHTEFKITSDGAVYLIEIGSRMGGDFIGSDLVLHSTGYDFVKTVIDVSLGITITEKKLFKRSVSITFFSNKKDYTSFLSAIDLSKIIEKGIIGTEKLDLYSSSDRFAYVIHY